MFGLVLFDLLLLHAPTRDFICVQASSLIRCTHYTCMYTYTYIYMYVCVYT